MKALSMQSSRSAFVSCGALARFTAVSAFLLLGFLSIHFHRDLSVLRADGEDIGSQMLRAEQALPIKIQILEKERDEWRERALAAEAKSSKNVQAPSQFSSASDYIAAFGKYIKVGYFSTSNNGDDLWKLWEEQGVHVVPVHYYSPIVSDADLEEHYVARKATKFDLIGLDMNDSFQHKILTEMTVTYRDELLAFPKSLPEGVDPSKSLTYTYGQGMFNINDASLYHTIIRHFHPQRIIEVGSGNSLKISMAAGKLNDNGSDSGRPQTDITVIEPFPDQSHNSHLLKADGINRLVVKKIQDVPLEEFDVLEANDILFLDSSHVVATGTDTVHEFLNILPRLAKGVIVHVHDIFLPHDLPRHWVMGEHRGWSEQYLLAAFLMYNSDFEVVASSSYMVHKFQEEIKAAMPERFHQGGGSFWFRRIKKT
uniref:Class I SAM-dependent methyltransferase n=1 Tax=Amphora coffeiformis TaxID=265554 RepID=A0A7S3L9S6_9STRA